MRSWDRGMEHAGCMYEGVEEGVARDAAGRPAALAAPRAHALVVEGRQSRGRGGTAARRRGASAQTGGGDGGRRRRRRVPERISLKDSAEKKAPRQRVIERGGWDCHGRQGRWRGRFSPARPLSVPVNTEVCVRARGGQACVGMAGGMCMSGCTGVQGSDA